MTSKQINRARSSLSIARHNAIYALALKRPHGGYAASPKFTSTIVSCPKCGGTVYARIRFLTDAVLGAVCDRCPWRNTYSRDSITEPQQTQPDLFIVQKSNAPDK